MKKFTIWDLIRLIISAIGIVYLLILAKDFRDADESLFIALIVIAITMASGLGFEVKKILARSSND